MAPKRDQVLICHSRADDEWLERLKTHLRPLLPAGCQIFDDTRIEPGTEHSNKLQEALLRARVVVLLVSADFLAAEFIPGQERLPLYAPAGPVGAPILWVPLRPSSFAVTKIAAYPPLHDPARPLSSLSETDADAALVEISKRIRAAMDGTAVPGAAAGPARKWWFTVGGQALAGERLAQAAVRELAEETGLRIHPDELLGPVWRRDAMIDFNGSVMRSREFFFVHRTTRFDPSAAGRTALERRYIHGHRWCDAADIANLARAGQTVYPLQLGELLDTAQRLTGAPETWVVPAEPQAIR